MYFLTHNLYIHLTERLQTACLYPVSNIGGEQSDWSWSEQTAGLED